MFRGARTKRGQGKHVRQQKKDATAKKERGKIHLKIMKKKKGYAPEETRLQGKNRFKR